MKPPISGLGRDVREEPPLPDARTYVPVLQDRRNVSDYAVLRVREETHAGAMLGSITSMSSVTMRQACKPREEDAESEEGEGKKKRGGGGFKKEYMLRSVFFLFEVWLFTCVPLRAESICASPNLLAFRLTRFYAVYGTLVA